MNWSEDHNNLDFILEISNVMRFVLELHML